MIFKSEFPYNLVAESLDSNKFTVLMFWASHCTHCMAELPGFASWYNKNQNSFFEIVAVSLDRSEKKWKQTVEENKFNWFNICQFKDNIGLVYKSPICLDYIAEDLFNIYQPSYEMLFIAYTETDKFKTYDDTARLQLVNNNLNI